MLFDLQPKWLAALRTAPLYICMPFLAANSYVLGMTVGPFVSYETRFKLIIGTFCRSVTWIAKNVCGVDYQVTGQEHIPKDKSGYVIMSKHQSTWETLFLQNIFDPNTVVLKQELFYVPFFGWGIALLNPIFINRRKGSSAMKQILQKGSERLQRGEDILIFPEGTRVEPGNRKSFSKGGALLATEAGVDVIPIAHNSGEHWNNKRWLKIPGTIQVIIGGPISTKGKSWEAVNAEVEEWINTEVDKISTYPYDEGFEYNDINPFPTKPNNETLMASAIRYGQTKWDEFKR